MLLVEDDHKFADLLVRAFAHVGIGTVHRSTGDTALHSLHRETFGAAVLDVMIPHPDGLEVCRHLRSLDRNIGIVAISARSGAEHRNRARAAGADAFVPKPLSLRELVELTSALLDRQPSERTAAR